MSARSRRGQWLDQARPPAPEPDKPRCWQFDWHETDQVYVCRQCGLRFHTLAAFERHERASGGGPYRGPGPTRASRLIDNALLAAATLLLAALCCVLVIKGVRLIEAAP